jgi:hypothetical protein
VLFLSLERNDQALAIFLAGDFCAKRHRGGTSKGKEERLTADIAGSRIFIEYFGERGRNRTFNLLIKSCCTSAGLTVAITVRNQALAHNLARTEALR